MALGSIERVGNQNAAHASSAVAPLNELTMRKFLSIVILALVANQAKAQTSQPDYSDNPSSAADVIRSL